MRQRRAGRSQTPGRRRLGQLNRAIEMTLPEIFVGDLVELQRACVREVEDAVRTAIATRGRALAALPGGSVAQAFFPALAESAADWTRTEVFWIDERAVPPRHPDSNYGLAASLLLLPAGVPEPRIHRLPAELPDLEQAARRASDELKSIAGDPPMLDLVLAGVGEDGHVASIFCSDVRHAARRGVRSGGARLRRAQTSRVPAHHDAAGVELCPPRHRRGLRPIESRRRSRRDSAVRRRDAGGRASAPYGASAVAARSRCRRVVIT